MPTNPFDASAEKSAIAATAAGKARPGNYVRFTASGTYVPTAGCKEVYVVCIGGGGGGGSGQVGAEGTLRRAGQGGYGAGWSDQTIPASLFGASVPITIGAGGSGGLPNGNDGSAGGTTAFGSFIQATGGQGGSSGNVAYVGGALASAGQGSVSGGLPAVWSSGDASSTWVRPAGLAPGAGGNGGSRTTANANGRGRLPGDNNGTGSSVAVAGTVDFAIGSTGISRASGDTRGGGGGGGSNSSATTSGAGGAGAIGSGGGGSGGGAVGTGAGGAGGAGVVHIFESF